MNRQSWQPKASALQNRTDYFVFIGTYTGGAGGGIHVCRFSAQGPELDLVGLAAEAINPSFLCVHPSGRFLYAVSEVSRHMGQPAGLVMAYAIDLKAGALAFLNQVLSRGAGPCHISTDRTGRTALVSNYAGGSVASIRILEDGSLGSSMSVLRFSDLCRNGQPGQKSHAHGAFVSGDNRFVVVPDLGLNRLWVYRLESSKGTLEPAEISKSDLEPGAGPRHFAFHPTGHYGYAICETDSTVRAFHFDRVRGSLRQFDSVSILPPGYLGSNIAAEIQIDRGGRYLYATNRGADSIAVLAIREEGRLELVENVGSGGKTPRHFSIDPTDSYLLAANQDSGNVVLFSRDRAGGRLEETGRRVAVNKPACIVFVRAE